MKKIIVGIILAAVTWAQSSYAGQSIKMENGTVRAPIPGMANTAGYMELTNLSKTDLVLTKAKSDFADKVEYHNHIMNDGVMKMVKLDKLVIPAGETITFQSGGLHLMFIGLTKQKPLPGKVTVTLTSESGQTFPVELDVKSIKAQHHHHHH